MQEAAMTDLKTVRDARSWTALFQPDVLAASQYYHRAYHPRRPLPEKMLMLAVLQDAISCFQRGVLASRDPDKSFREAEDWLFNEKSDWPFSFESICQALDLSPGYLKAGLIRWRRRATAKRFKVRLFYVVRIGRRARKNGRSRSRRHAALGRAGLYREIGSQTGRTK